MKHHIRIVYTYIYVHYISNMFSTHTHIICIYEYDMYMQNDIQMVHLNKLQFFHSLTESGLSAGNR